VDGEVCYTLGRNVGASLERFKLWSPLEHELLTAGIRDVLVEKTVDTLGNTVLKASKLCVNKLLKTRVQAKFKAHPASVAATLAFAAVEPGSISTTLGMAIYTLVKGPGSGTTPIAANKVRLNFEGMSTAGWEFFRQLGRVQRPSRVPKCAQTTHAFEAIVRVYPSAASQLAYL
jgi:FKBP-type peptidyl-prolyl cis-trans isomerase